MGCNASQAVCCALDLRQPAFLHQRVHQKDCSQQSLLWFILNCLTSSASPHTRPHWIPADPCVLPHPTAQWDQLRALPARPVGPADRRGR